MLNRHLIAPVRPIATPENVVSFKNYRISVLSDRLFRIERSEGGKFRDSATQSIWFRDMPKVKYTITYNGNNAIITTDSRTLIIAPEREDCRIIIDGKELPITNEGNLMGTYRTLDTCNGDWNFRKNVSINTLFDFGVCSRSGVAVLDDSKSLSLGVDGEIKEERADGTDEYVFAFGNDYRAALKALYMISGRTPIVPRFALGNWWSRYRDYTQEEYLHLCHRFRENDVPLTVATVDMDWHWSTDIDERMGITESGKNTLYYVGDNPRGIGWTGYSWNTELFPDYRSFLNDLHAMNLKVTLNLHPAEGVRYFEDCYAEMATAMGIDPKSEKCIDFDVSDTKFINNYFKILHKPYENDGVDFWWIDWQSGTTSRTQGLDPLWSLNHYHYLDNKENHTSPLILSRYSGIGSHRYPLGFSGDSIISWKMLDYLAYFTANSTNVGYTWWSHDIGGNHCGEKNDEMFLRHVQFGVFSPINRLHCSKFATMSKEPWIYEGGKGELVKEWLRLRHKLIPYLYSASFRNHEYGEAIIEPLYYEWDTEPAYKYKNEYLFGKQLLVIPVSEKSDTDGYTRIRAWIPEGEWTDIFTADKYYIAPGGEEKTLMRRIDSIPVLARAGSIIPMSRDSGNSVANPERLDIHAFRGNGEFELYEDLREEGDESSAITRFVSSLNTSGDTARQTVKITANGEGRVIPEARRIRILFKDIDWEGARITVRKNGTALELPVCYADSAACEFEFDMTAEYEIEVAFSLPARLEEIKKRATDVLLRAEIPNECKHIANNELMESESVERFISNVNWGATLPAFVKDRLLETV